MTNTHAKYVPIDASQIPDDVRFDIPRRNQGQIVLVAYGGDSRGEHDEGDPYMRVVDQSEGQEAAYYVLRDFTGDIARVRADIASAEQLEAAGELNWWAAKMLAVQRERLASLLSDSPRW